MGSAETTILKMGEEADALFTFPLEAPAFKKVF